MKTRKKIFSSLLVIVMLFTMLPTTAFAEGTTITVAADGSGDYTTIQAAINAISKDGGTIEIESGTYDRFYVSKDYSNLTIKAVKGADVTVNVLDGNEDTSAIYGANISGAECGTQCCLIRGEDITLSGLTFSYGGVKKVWYDSAVAVYTTGAVTIKNCEFDGTDNIGYGIFAQNGVCSLTITNCEFDNLDQAIWGENTSSWFVATDISNNIFTNCSFAVHWGYNAKNIITDNAVDEAKKAGYSADGNYFKFIDNYVCGTETLRNKVVLQDSYDVDMCAVTISGNELAYGLIGLVNIADTTEDGYQLTSDVLKDNTFGISSFVVEATSDYAAGKEEVAVYKADQASDGKWVLNDTKKLAEQSFYPLIEQAVKEANETGSKELQITGLEGYEDVLYTFTWYKDAIYWEGTSTKTSYPGLEKWIETGDNSLVKEDTIAAGDTVDFVLKSNVPQDLTNYLEAGEVNEPSVARYDSELNGGEYWLAFHDDMDKNLSLDKDSIKVAIKGEDVDAKYYKIFVPGENCADGCTFEVVMDLVALYDAGYFTEGDFGTAEIVVTYSATASETLTAGEYLNTGWVEYEGGQTKEDTVTVETFGINIFKYDQTTNKGLKGAKFELWAASVDDNGNVEKVGNSAIDTLKSASDGYATIEGLDAGTYALYEVEAPSGYAASKKPLVIVIPDDVNENDNIAYVKFANAEIPNTGGTGTLMYTMGGIAIMAAASVLFVISRRKKANM